MGFVVIATWTAKKGEADRIRKILEDMTPGKRAEPKMRHFQAQVSDDDPSTFVIYEHYADISGYEEHRASGAFQARVLGEAIPNLESRHVSTFTTIGD
jgi:quinol monooxygenase YgiN